jgi:pimeloyl-ACP methyl ester carboxylesterase
MKIFLKILLAIIFIVAAFTCFLYYKSPGTTPPVPGGIASLEQIELGGLKQWVLMRGRNVNKPVLLILHGGPGSPELAMVRQYNRELEKHFVVVNWEQRGAGKSWSKDIKSADMKISVFVSDAEELVVYLRKRFKMDKIYIEGHSWGSALAALLAQKIPQYIKAYVGIGQATNIIESEKLVFERTLEVLKKAGDKKMLLEMQEASGMVYGDLKKTMTQRKCSMKYGGLVYKNPLSLLAKALINCSEYTPEDKFVRFASGSLFSLKAMWNELVMGNMFKSAAKWKVPVYIIAGRHDLTVDPGLAEKYFNFIKAPKKEFFWFENSAHMCSYEEPEKYMDIMINIVLKDNEFSINH